MLGHGEGLGDLSQLGPEKTKDLERIHKFFQDVPTSLFTLFQLTTTDNWDAISDPLVGIDTRWRLFFVSFIAFASWIMISVLTAVASDCMIAATSDRKDFELKEIEAKQMQFIAFLRDSFIKSDADGNGFLDKEEFKQMIAPSSFVWDEMRRLGISLSEEELNKAWEMLDVGERGVLTIEDFVAGLSCLQEGLATKHVVTIDYSLRSVTAKCEERWKKLETSLVELQQQNKEIVQKLSEQEKNSVQLNKTLWLWQRWALQNDDFKERLQGLLPTLKMVSPS